MKSAFNFNRPYVRNGGKGFTPIYIPGENYSFYINFSDIPPSAIDSFTLYLCDALTNAQLVVIPGLQRVYTAGIVGYHLYNQNFVFPKVIDGQYFFQICTTGTNEVGRSNIVICRSNCLDTTAYTEFRHDDALFGVRYDLLPNTFYQKFRLPINQVKAIEVRSSRDQYRQSSGQRELRLSKSFRDIVVTLEMYWSNAEDFEALSAMLEHSKVIINGSKLILLDQVKVELPSDFSVQYKGTFTCIVEDDAQSNSAPDLFLRGGTNNYIYKNIFAGK